VRGDGRGTGALPDVVVVRLMRLAGSKLTQNGVIVITAQRFRDQARNRADALERLVALIQEALIPPTPRRATKPTLASKKRRLEGKAKRSGVKAMRGGVKVD